MQLNTTQFFAALMGAEGSVTVTAGIATLESGDTFDVSTNVVALATVFAGASAALMDAAEKLSRHGSSTTYPATRGRLLELRQELAGHEQSAKTGVLQSSGSTADRVAIATALGEPAPR